MKSFRNYFDENCPPEYTIFGWRGQLDWKRLKDEEILTEGLITSYPFTSVMSMLHQTYADCVTHLEANPIISDKGSGKACGISFYVKKEKYSEDFKNELGNNLKVYGYFITFSEPYGENEMGIFIEPKFPFVIEPKYLKNKRFFHTTHKKYLPKIEKNGLVPRYSETNYAHDGNRIYLMASDNEEIMNSWKKTLSDSKGWSITDMVILEVDASDLKLYIDPNFEHNKIYTSVFTFNNIDPKRFKIIA